MSEWYETRAGLWARMWDRLSGPDRAREVALATVDADGLPQNRIVVLRGGARDPAVVEIYTDRHSAKVQELLGVAHGAVVLWSPGDALQIRLCCRVRVVSGVQVRDVWDALPAQARQNYGCTPPPGQEIAGALDYVKMPEAGDFTILHCEIDTVDLVHLGAVHRRAAYARSDGFDGRWLVP